MLESRSERPAATVNRIYLEPNGIIMKHLPIAITAALLLASPVAHAAPDKTVLALETLAASGSTRAEFELGRRFENGIGATADSRKAFNFYCKAASTARRRPRATRWPLFGFTKCSGADGG
jgi:TPR repeat protein